MTQPLDLLLDALHTDRETAGLEYERLRTRLIRLFEWERCGDAGFWADQVLDRTAERLAGGENLANVPAFAAAVARLVVLEALRVQRREKSLSGEIDTPSSPTSETEREDALEECLSALTSEARVLILKYYQGDGQTRIRNRESLALESGLSLNSLRNRALRIRERLEECVRKKTVLVNTPPERSGSRDASAPTDTGNEERR
ncbi:MAG: hypothetical protein H7039_00820 [Bryobacteraceae bacterium]|nr:hypothetical protein [Bryobacteraceae bacterium]